MIRLSTSRPMSSVPNGWARLGAESRISGWGSSGSYGASTSAKIAISTITTSSAAETAPSGFFLIVRQRDWSRPMLAAPGSSNVTTCAGTVAIRASLVPDPRVKPRVSQVDEEIQRDQSRRDEHDVGLHHRIVAVEDRLHREPAHAGQREDLLDDERPGQQDAELAADDRDHRDQRVLERVLVDDDASGQALGP